MRLRWEAVVGNLRCEVQGRKAEMGGLRCDTEVGRLAVYERSLDYPHGRVNTLEAV